ncbi:DUF4926 domain-containing protein [Sulfitobacter porphyrae]|uniref:DUF4926 domain-containing protein n=1 Tax=Sulfitobacter porphyrae TaxID=1246864 RepID=A0ABW2B6N1_9RHOB|nr:hypothetical protein GCM10007928_51600 [Sulfitobacter porphyrae]
MNEATPTLFDMVELTSATENMPIGAVGTIVDVPPGSEDYFVVEFVDSEGVTIAIKDLTLSDFRLLTGNEC